MSSLNIYSDNVEISIMKFVCKSVIVRISSLLIHVLFYIMDPEDFEQACGWRPVFNQLPSTKNMAQKIIMPTGFFYSPFAAQPEELKKGKYPTCLKCKAGISPHCQKDRNMGKWICNFCGSDNPFIQGFGNALLEETYETKVGDCGLYFIIDTCVSREEMHSIKETLITSIKKMPQEIFVGLIYYNENVMMANFEGDEVEYTCMCGTENYPTIKEIGEALGTVQGHNINFHPKSLVNKYFVPLSKNLDKLIEAVNDLEEDTHFVPKEDREKRASGAAHQIAVNAICPIGINTRFVSILGGPCTIGPGKVVDLPLKKTIRVYMDIIEGSENAQYLKGAKKFYDDLSNIIISNKCTMDMWAYGLDQFGLIEMR